MIMMRRLAATVVLALLAATQLGGAPPPRIVVEWNSPEDAGTKFDKIRGIGITEDRELRHRFEDNVSHLRGRDSAGAGFTCRQGTWDLA